jgi:hypothetical protein
MIYLINNAHVSDFVVFMAVIGQIVFLVIIPCSIWVVTPYSLTGGYRLFAGRYHSHKNLGSIYFSKRPHPPKKYKEKPIT